LLSLSSMVQLRLWWQPRSQLLQASNDVQIAELAGTTVTVVLAIWSHEYAREAVHTGGIRRSQLAYELAGSSKEIEAINVHRKIATADKEAVAVLGR
jgi:hypothetical protein